MAITARRVENWVLEAQLSWRTSPIRSDMSQKRRKRKRICLPRKGKEGLAAVMSDDQSGRAM